MSGRTIAVWIAANVAAALALGVANCRDPFFPPVLPGAIFGLAQTVALVPLSRRFLAWFPVTLIVTPPAMYVSGLVLMSMWGSPSVGSSGDPRTPVETLIQIAASGVPGWLIVAAAQAIVLMYVGLRAAWWLPAVAIGGAALAPLGFDSALGGWAYSKYLAGTAASPPNCSLTAAAGGPVAWAAAGLWYSGVTAVALRAMHRRTSEGRVLSDKRGAAGGAE